MRTVFITGVSSGLGRGTAQAFCQRGYRVIGTVRSAADADRARADLGANLWPLLLDVRDLHAVARLPETLNELGFTGPLTGLVNNAGIVCSAPVLTQPMADIVRQFEVNVLGLIAVTQALLPMLGANNAGVTGRPTVPGRIINISSVGGRVASPFIAGYNASKHAVEGFSHALRRELMPFQIPVIIVGPGSVRTAIWSKAKARPADFEPGFVYREPMRRFADLSSRLEASGYTEQEAGRRIVAIFEARRPSARYALVRGRLLNWTLPSLLPDRWLDIGVGRALGLLPQSLRIADGRVASDT